MNHLLISVHLTATATSCAIIWMAQVVLYPQFRNVPPDAFSKFHQDHMRRMAYLVGPALLLEGVSATILLSGFASGWSPYTLIAYCLLAGTTLTTFCYFVPLHTRLQEAHDAGAIERLISANKVRATLQTARLILIILAPGISRQ